MSLKDDFNDILYEMSNLHQSETGIKSIIFISGKGKSKHGPRIKLSSNNNPNNLDISIMVSNKPEIKHGEKLLKSKELKLINKWIILNKKIIVDYWNYEISTKEMIKTINKLK